MQAQSIVKDATTRKDRMLSSGTSSKSNSLINHPVIYKGLRRKRKKTRSCQPFGQNVAESNLSRTKAPAFWCEPSERTCISRIHDETSAERMWAHWRNWLKKLHYMAMAQNDQPPKWMVFLLNIIISVGHWNHNFEPNPYSWKKLNNNQKCLLQSCQNAAAP